MKTILRGVRMALIAGLLTAPHSGFAVGSEDNFKPPQQTETTKDCFSERQWDPEIKSFVRYSDKVNGVWDPQLRRCIRPDKAGYLKSEVLKDAVRELAYAGRSDEARAVLAQLNPEDDFVLTYLGFLSRKDGDLDAANIYYHAALKKNPDNLLVRSYMGQGLVSQGKMKEAWIQLVEIRQRGGADGWPEAALRKAIETGASFNY